MTNPRAVILGAAGFIGSHLCDRFLREGWSVVGIDNFITGTRRNLDHLARESRFDLVEGEQGSEGSRVQPFATVVHGMLVQPFARRRVPERAVKPSPRPVPGLW